MLGLRPRSTSVQVFLTALVVSGATGCAAKSPRSVKPEQQTPETTVETSPSPPPPQQPPNRTTLHWPHGHEWGEATLRALRSQRTWIPAAAAVAVAPWDRKISDWATSNTPVFGSVHNAQRASDDLLGLSELSMIVTIAVEPGGDTPWRSRFNRFLVEYGAVSAANLTSSGLKDVVTRTRPDGDGKDSFPSGHSTRAFASATMASVNLQGTPMPAGLRIGLDAGITTFAAGTAWARVEGGRHFPSDVLAGAAVGSFVSTWVHECFLRENRTMTIDIEAGRHEWSASARWAF